MTIRTALLGVEGLVQGGNHRTYLVGVEGLVQGGNHRTYLFGVEGLVPQLWGHRAGVGSVSAAGDLTRSPGVSTNMAGDWRFVLSSAKIQTGSTVTPSGPAGVEKVDEFEHASLEWILSGFVEHDDLTAITLTRSAGTLDVWAAVELPLTYYGTEDVEVLDVVRGQSGPSDVFRPPALTDVPAGSVVVILASQDDNNGMLLNDAQGFTIIGVSSTSTGSDMNWGFAWAEIPVDTPSLTMPEFLGGVDSWMTMAIVVGPNQGIDGTVAATNNDDTLVAAGDFIAPITGTVAATNNDDTLAATSEVIAATTGTVAATNADDTLEAEGDRVNPTTGTVSHTNADDTLAARATFLGYPLPKNLAGIAPKEGDHEAGAAGLNLPGDADIDE